MLNRALVQVMPSTACNARCSYCYEEGRRILAMDDDVMQATTSFIVSLFESYEHVALVWFGGEPLLHMQEIERMALEIMTHLNYQEDRLTQSVITNGALLGKALENLFFRRCGISAIQVSMDGYDDVNDKTKGFIVDGCSYHDLLSSIENCLIAGYHVTVRMNASSTNEESLIALAKNLQQVFYKFDNLSIYPAPLYGKGSGYLDMHSVYKTIYRLRSSIGSHFMGRRNSDSGCLSDSTFVIQPDGYVIPCEHLFGMSEHYLGNILHGVQAIDATSMATACRKCVNYRICKQGCASLEMGNLVECDTNGIACWRNV